MKIGHSWTTFKVLGKISMIKIIPRSRNCFILAFLQVMSYQIPVFFIVSSSTYWLLKDLASLLRHLNNSRFTIHLLILPSPIIFNDTRIDVIWLFGSFFYYCHYYFSRPSSSPLLISFLLHHVIL